MKCQYCGANLTIDDEVCSFCGSANAFATKHRKEMHRFTREFNRTKSDVLTKSRDHSKWVAKITLIAVLVALNLLVLFAVGNSYEIEEFIVARKAESNYFLHKAKLDEYEENRQYIAFTDYFSQNQLYYSDMFDEYRAVSDVCGQYASIYRYMMEIVTQEDTDYYTHEQRLEYIADQIEYVYMYSEKDDYDREEQYTEEHQACMDDAVAQVEALIQTYFGVSDEDMSGFRELSKARRQILMEEGLELYEE